MVYFQLQQLEANLVNIFPRYRHHQNIYTNMVTTEQGQYQVSPQEYNIGRVPLRGLHWWIASQLYNSVLLSGTVMENSCFSFDIKSFKVFWE